MRKLHLGCADRKIHGFINIDAREEVHPDQVGPVCNLDWLGFDKRTVDVIYACHVLEHFRNPYLVLKHWYSYLKEGGVLRISVPDFEKVVEHYLEYRDIDLLHGFLNGGLKYDLDVHYHTWDQNHLEYDLRQIGFKEVTLYDRDKTEHFYVDDYSAAYLPHMDRNGMLMSLNMEAIK